MEMEVENNWNGWNKIRHYHSEMGINLMRLLEEEALKSMGVEDKDKFCAKYGWK
jgi:hypothetical protein